jgi:manganese transport protein
VLKLLIMSQVVLSLQLPFAIVPLIRFTSAPAIMGSLVSPRWLRRLACAAALLIIALNAWLVVRTLTPVGGGLAWVALGTSALLCCGLLAWIALVPLKELPAAAAAGDTASNKYRSRDKA